MRRLATFVACMIPIMASAETVTFQSGEHETFSRLVLSVPRGTDWSVEPSERGYVARFGPEVSGFDLRGAFEKIPRDRIGNIEVGDRSIELLLGCDCPVEASLFAPGLVMIDVLDPGTEQTAAVLPQRPPVVQTPDVEPARTNGAASAAQTTLVEPITLPLFTPSERSAPIEPRFDLRPSIPEPRDTTIVEAERAILESFARAATQGIFDFPAQPLPPPLDGSDAPPPSIIAPVSDPMEGVPIPFAEGSEDRPGVVLRTGLDRSGPEDDLAPPTTCPLSSEVNVAAWGGSGEFTRVIPDLRRAVTNEAAGIEQEALLTLAKAYIHFGFGLEARHTLDQLPNPGTETPLLHALAALVDGEDIPSAALLPYRACGPSMEMWIALASGRLNDPSERISSAVVMGYRALPDPLRGHLGIRLAETFTQAGDLFTAEELLGVNPTTTTGGGRAAAIADANLQRASLGNDAERERLAQFIETSPRAEPTDLVRLLDLSEQTEMPVPEDTLDLAAAMRFENEGTDDAIALLDAEVRSTIASGRGFEALTLLNDANTTLPADRQMTLRSSAIAQLARDLDDTTFLTLAFGDLPTDLNVTAIHALVERLVVLGFPQDAERLLQRPAEGSEPERRAFLEAQIAVQLEAWEEIDALLTNVSPDNASVIDRQRREALGLGEGLDDAWANGDWARLSASDDPLLSRASAELLSPVAAPSETTRLADTSALIGDATNTRDLTRQLLDRFEIDEPLPSTP